MNNLRNCIRSWLRVKNEKQSEYMEVFLYSLVNFKRETRKVLGFKLKKRVFVINKFEAFEK